MEKFDIICVEDPQRMCGYRKKELRFGENVWAEADENGVIDYECLRDFLGYKVDIHIPQNYAPITCTVTLDKTVQPNRIIIE